MIKVFEKEKNSFRKICEANEGKEKININRNEKKKMVASSILATMLIVYLMWLTIHEQNTK